MGHGSATPTQKPCTKRQRAQSAQTRPADASPKHAERELAQGTQLAQSADAPPAHVEQYQSPGEHQQSEEAQPELVQQQVEW
ncbi:hypothetical protein HPB52_004698 [Rhipicephalus sanguineus]|uniref:Uncharacterized protein n=1 Tax=Rhipicephalus sanguineus TaxID=34632 RepID=A0A9D4SQU9_RHISA|nr:hypothetical protein HPB52_006536 [Rhipicephalus sanguineus]KAH7982427.1 hypothetical protein HPB52_004698 [Rhipicephalus sanguineus]